MSLSNLKSSDVTEKIIAFFAAIILFAFAVYCFSPAGDSDFVEGTLWAEAALEAGRPLSPDFVYPYAIPFGGNLFILPFVYLFGVCQLANSCGMLLSYVVLVLTGAVFISSLTENKYAVLPGTALLILAYRSVVGANQLHHILYYQLGHICLLGILGTLFFIRRHRGGWKAWLGLALYTVWAGSNGLVLIVLSVVPVVVPVVLLPLLQGKRPQWKLFFALIAAALLGFVFYLLAMRGVRESGYLESTGSFRFQSPDRWGENLRAFPGDWFGLFGFDGQLKTAFLPIPPTFLEKCISLVAGMVAGIIPVCFICGMRKHGKPFRDLDLYVLAAWVIVWAVCLLQYVLFRGHERRLLFNGVLVNFVLLTVLFADNENHYAADNADGMVRRKRNGRPAALSAVLLAAYAVSFVASAVWHVDTSVTDELQSGGLYYGFASYWNSNYFTVQSGNQVKIRPVLVSDGNLSPLLYNSNVSWFSEEQCQGRPWFVLLSAEEFEELESSSNKILLEQCADVLDLGDFHALVFSAEQWSTVLLGLGYEYSFQDEKWSRDCMTENGHRAIAVGGVSFGPYIWIPENHVCRITIKGQHLAQAEISVYSQADGVSLTPEYEMLTDQEIVFSVAVREELRQLEVAIRNAGASEPVILESEVIEVTISEGA